MIIDLHIQCVGPFDDTRTVDGGASDSEERAVLCENPAKIR